MTSYQLASRLLIALGTLGLLSCAGDHAVPMQGGRVVVAREFWTPLENPEPFADNFESRSSRPGQRGRQELTMFKYPMRDDQRGDMQFGPSTRESAFVVFDSVVVIDVQVAHPSHWIASRQYFEPRVEVDQSLRGLFLQPEDARHLVRPYVDEICRTQAVLLALTAH